MLNAQCTMLNAQCTMHKAECGRELRLFNLSTFSTFQPFHETRSSPRPCRALPRNRLRPHLHARPEPDSNEFGIVVNVFADGRLELFGRRYDRDGLVAKLIDVQGGLRSDDSRMIVLKGHEGVTPRDLESLHEFLVTRHLYRISVETPRTASATGVRFRPILPEGGLQAQDLSPDDPLVKQLFGDE